MLVNTTCVSILSTLILHRTDPSNLISSVRTWMSESMNALEVEDSRILQQVSNDGPQQTLLVQPTPCCVRVCPLNPTWTIPTSQSFTRPPCGTVALTVLL